MVESVIEVSAIDFPGGEYYSTLKRPLEHYEKGVFIIEGDKVVERFFDSQLIMISILLTHELFELHRECLEKRSEKIKVYLAEKKTLAKIVGFKYHQGIIAVGRIPPLLSIDEILQNKKSGHLLVALDRLESAENTGVLVRNCAACGVDAIIVGENSADPYLRRAVRNSMGTVFRIPVIKSQSLYETLSILKAKHGFQILAAHPRDNSIPLPETDLIKDTCIVFGNEGEGVSSQIVDVSDYAVKIPMVSGVDSFNVACASAIMLYEVNRQRTSLNQYLLRC